MDAFHKLIRIDFLIPIFVYLCYQLKDILLYLFISLSLQHNCYFLLADFSIVIPVEQIESLLQIILLLLVFLFQSKGDELAELQSSIVIDVQLAESFFSYLLAHFFAIDVGISCDQLLKGQDTITVYIQVFEYLLQLLSLFFLGKVVVYVAYYCCPKFWIYFELSQPLQSLFQKYWRFLLLCVVLEPRVLECLLGCHSLCLIFVHQINNKFLSFRRQWFKCLCIGLQYALFDNLNGVLGVLASKRHLPC